MKVLMISGDKNVLVPGTPPYERAQMQRSAVEQLDIVVWPQVDSLYRIFNLARKNRYDVITAQDPLWRGHLAHHLTQIFGGKLNIQVHMDLAALPWWKRQFARYQLWCANSIRVVSERTRREVEALGIKRSTTVLPIYINLEPFTHIVRSRHPRFAKTILWVGRFEQEKDPLLALKVLKDVRAKGVDAGLVMLGTGSLEGALKRAAQGLPVEFPGWGDPAPDLGHADVMLNTSPYESYGAAIIEALATGTPVVSMDVGISKEAGACVVAKERLAGEVARVLGSGTRGTLCLALPSAEAWARRWRETLR